MTLNYIWWWDSIPLSLEGVEYHFITITPRSTLTQNVKVLFMGQMDLFKNYLYR